METATAAAAPGSSTSTGLPPDFGSIAAAAHHTLLPFLRTREALGLGLAAKALLQPFGSRCPRLSIGYGVTDWPAGEALRRLIARQEALEMLFVHNPEQLPPVAAGLLDNAGSAGRRLKMLGLMSQQPFEARAAAALASVVASPHGGLPALEDLAVLWQIEDGAIVGRLSGALARGGSPRLKTVSFHLSLHGTEDRTAAVDTLAAALEARAGAGCCGLGRLDVGLVMNDVPWETRRRLLAVLIHSAVFIPDSWLDQRDGDGLADVIVEAGGAPCLQLFEARTPLSRDVCLCWGS
jgi:hypothetical protein